MALGHGPGPWPWQCELNEPFRRANRQPVKDAEVARILGEQLRRRVRQRVRLHCFRREVARRILRREIIERLYEWCC